MVELATTDLWRNEDAAWERLQQEGCDALAECDTESAARKVGQALQLARQHFQLGDPRLASSLTNQALLLRQKKDPLADRLFEEALFHWDRCEAWLDDQPPPRRRAKSSLFHLRLEAKHPGAYESHRRRHDLELMAKARRATQDLAAQKPSVDDQPPRTWRPETCQTFDTARKISAAVHLMARR